MATEYDPGKIRVSEVVESVRAWHASRYHVRCTDVVVVGDEDGYVIRMEVRREGAETDVIAPEQIFV